MDQTAKWTGRLTICSSRTDDYRSHELNMTLTSFGVLKVSAVQPNCRIQTIVAMTAGTLLVVIW